MKIDFFRSDTLDAAEAYMGRLAQRLRAVSSNISNIDTPGFKTQDVPFYATMQELLADKSTEMKKTSSGHMASGMPLSRQTLVFEVEGLTSRSDENNVDIDREMKKLSQTTFGYSLMTEIIRSKFRTLSSSINEGGRG